MAGCKNCGGSTDRFVVMEIPPQPSEPRPARPQTIQGQAPPRPTQQVAMVTEAPKPARKTQAKTRKRTARGSR